MRYKILAVVGAITVSILAMASNTPGASPSYDVVVYGGTASGAVAAIEASRQGESVALVEPSAYVGGMLTGGLTHTDIGATPSVISGVAKEFYVRVGAAYGGGPYFDYEPKVGRQVLDQMLADAHVLVSMDQQGIAANGVTKTGTTITSLRTEAGSTFAGKQFIDASYEGDLMAGAGVSYTTGRESNTQYGEGFAGVQPYSKDFTPAMSAYDRSGKLLPQVSAEPLRAPGSADDHVQAYNYRITATDVAANRLAFPKPAAYDPNDYALLARWLPSYRTALHRELTASDFFIFSKLPGGKYDVNNYGAFSTDMMNASFDYANATSGQRQAIAARIKNYDQGLMYYLQHDSAVPTSLRVDMARYGLPKDEYTANDNWPTQLYVREARRMVGDFVLTQKDLQTDPIKADTVALGSYRLDQHSSFRGVDSSGDVRNEGAFNGTVTTASEYGLPYRMMTPKLSQTTNLLVTVTPSTSHVAWSGVRMEPQLMMLGQAAGDAAAMSINGDCPVQGISVPALQRLLTRRGVVLVNAPQTGAGSDNDDGTPTFLRANVAPCRAPTGI